MSDIEPRELTDELLSVSLLVQALSEKDASRVFVITFLRREDMSLTWDVPVEVFGKRVLFARSDGMMCQNQHCDLLGKQRFWLSDQVGGVDDPHDVLPRNLLLAIKVTSKCNGSCGFCFERYATTAYSDAPTDAFVDRIRNVLGELSHKNLIGTVSLTGGEPTLDVMRCRAVLNALSEWSQLTITINTNGNNIRRLSPELSDDQVKWINVSKHDLDDSDSTFLSWAALGAVAEKLGPKLRLQCVVQKCRVHDSEGVRRYLERACEAGISRVAFLEMATLPDYYAAHGFCAENAVSLQPILEELCRDGYAVSQQHTSDYCRCATLVSRDGVRIFAKTADIVTLMQVETDHEDTIARQWIIHPDGTLSHSWNPSKGVILRNLHETRRGLSIA